MSSSFSCSRGIVPRLPLATALLATLSGCAFAPRSELTSAQLQNRLLSEQAIAQAAEIDNLKNHSHQIEDKLIDAEQQLAQLDQQSQADRKRLAAMHDELYDGRGRRLPAELSRQLA